MYLAINMIFSFACALALHELGHLLAARACGVRVMQAGLGWGPKLFGLRVRGVDYQFRLLPLGAYVQMDMAGLQKRRLVQQLFVLLAGIAVNLLLAAVTWGSFFGTLNLVLGVVNLFPIYQQDGWKSGMVFFRRVFKRTSPLVEWSFTLSPGIAGLILMLRAFSF
jgi:membrane-associated protease RseP (regulator of RpoE activity)